MHQENPATTAIIAWHTGDEFEFQGSTDRTNWYGITGFPTVKFDGIEEVIGGYDPSSYPYYVPVFEDRIGTPSNFSIDMEITNTDATDYNVNATIEILDGINTENTVAYVVLTETAVISPGNADQNFTARSFWPDNNGHYLDFSTISSHEISTTVTVEDGYVFENCEVVVWLQNFDTKEVYQGTSLMLSDITIGIEKQEKYAFELYPNPAHNRLNIKSQDEIQKVEIYNHAGQLVEAKEVSSKILNISTSHLNPGLYMIRVNTIEGSSVQQVIIQ